MTDITFLKNFKQLNTYIDIAGITEENIDLLYENFLRLVNDQEIKRDKYLQINTFKKLYYNDLLSEDKKLSLKAILDLKNIQI